MNAVVKKIETILRSSYDTKNYVDLIREIFPKVSIVSPDKFRKEFTNFCILILLTEKRLAGCRCMAKHFD